MTIADILAGGVDITPYEAIAVVQKLIKGEAGTYDPRPPFGPPTLTTVAIDENGAVRCRGCAITPSVAEAAILLQALLPAGALRVPGGLRYAVARALHEVSAPPFDSTDEFSSMLKRFERGDPDDEVRALFSRARSALAAADADREPPRPDTDRRRAMPPASELRRQLREADQHVYELQIAAAGDRRRTRGLMPVSVSIAIGLALVMAGGFMHSGPSPTAAVAPVATAAAQHHEASTTDLPLRSADIRTEDWMLRAGQPAEHARAGSRPERSRQAGAKSQVRNRAERKDPSRTTVEADRGATPHARRPPPAGVLARIRFEWGEL